MATQILSLPEGKIAFELSGASGPLVVCVPGLGDLRGEYRFLAPRLAQAGYRVASMDVRGHGETSTRWADFSVEGVGGDIIALIRHLNTGPAVVIGTSMAGGAAVVAAADAPELVSGLVMIDPFVRGEGSWPLKLLFRIMFARPWGTRAWARYMTSLYPSHKPDDFDVYLEELKRNLAEPGRLEATLAMMMTGKTASEQRIEKVKAPVMVLMGTKDPDFPKPEDEARWIAEALHGQYHMIDGAGHYPHAEFPDLTSDIICNFLKKIERENAPMESVYAS